MRIVSGMRASAGGRRDIRIADCRGRISIAGVFLRVVCGALLRLVVCVCMSDISHIVDARRVLYDVLCANVIRNRAPVQTGGYRVTV